jgi:hypothetical protein
MGCVRLVILGLVLAPSRVLARPARAPSENVTVTGTRSREVLHDFVQSFAAPTRLTGKIARWMDGICPVAVGLPAGFTNFVIRRLKDIAGKVGAPVDGNASCKPNIEIVFTTTPQALLDNIKKNQSALLGYYDNASQRDRLATVTRPIQAWYATATRDLHGKIQVDSSKTMGEGLEIWLPCPTTTGSGLCLMHFPNANAYAVTGSRLGDGLRSSFHHVIVVADPDKLVGTEMGALADYIAMLAQNCEKKSNTLSENDLAYLHGLYKMSPDMTPGIQKDQVSYQMERDLTGH